jgi:hypothetical protein
MIDRDITRPNRLIGFNRFDPFIGLFFGTLKSQNDAILDSHADHKEMVVGDYKPNQWKEQHRLHGSGRFQGSKTCFWPSSRTIL